jgi:hypothetical protein
MEGRWHLQGAGEAEEECTEGAKRTRLRHVQHDGGDGGSGSRGRGSSAANQSSKGLDEGHAGRRCRSRRSVLWPFGAVPLLRDRRTSCASSTTLLVVLAAAAVPCIAQDKYQEGYKCFQQDVVVSKGGCKGSVKGSSCADTSRAAVMQADIGRIWFEGKVPSHCKDYFTSVCLGVGGTVKAHILKRTLVQ